MDNPYSDLCFRFARDLSAPWTGTLTAWLLWSLYAVEWEAYTDDGVYA